MFTTRESSVPANVILVTLPGRRGEHIHKFEMFSKLEYVVIKPRILSLIARHPALQLPCSLYLNSCGWAQMLPPNYEVDI